MNELETVKAFIKNNPQHLNELLGSIAEHLDDFKEECRRQRNAEADKAILMLVCTVADWKTFSKLSTERKKDFMQGVIAYHYPNGLKGSFSQGEKDFFNMFAKDPPLSEEK
jgi:hypothetical protein